VTCAHHERCDDFAGVLVWAAAVYASAFVMGGMGSGYGYGCIWYHIGSESRTVGSGVRFGWR